MKRKNPDALTEDETAFLKSDRCAPSLRAFTTRQHESITIRTSAYRKVAAAARAERDALIEVAMLDLTRAKINTSTLAQDRVKALESEKESLDRELESTRLQLRQATAGPAMVVYGSDD